jgi:hypothetical protein
METKTITLCWRSMDLRLLATRQIGCASIVLPLAASAASEYCSHCSSLPLGAPLWTRERPHLWLLNGLRGAVHVPPSFFHPVAPWCTLRHISRVLPNDHWLLSTVCWG